MFNSHIELKEVFKKIRFLLILIILLGIVLRFLYIQRIDFDEVTYITGAMNILSGSYTLDTYWAPHLRYVFIGIITPFVFFFGPYHYAVIPIPFLSTIGNIIIIYFIHKKIKNPTTLTIPYLAIILHSLHLL